MYSGADSDLRQAWELGEFHGKHDLPWMAPEVWPVSMQGAYTRGFALGVEGTRLPVDQAEMILVYDERERKIELIAEGLIYERKHPAALRAKALSEPTEAA
jgi:hypothetical protein